MINKEKVISAVESAREIMFDAQDYIWKHPETGYKEWETQKYLADRYEEMGYKLNYAGNIPGFYTEFDTGREGPTIMILGEMDSLICSTHPNANPETGAVHACGHNAQSAALLGIAAALKVSEVCNGLCGKIRLCAAPAEELIELGYREELRKKGVIHYYGGKVELMYRGFFDNVDIAFMFHTSFGDIPTYSVGKGQNGCIVKNVTYQGVAAHAGGSPESGINAIYAANIGLNTINALRETFPERDHIRVHPIITYGGTAVNAIPNKVMTENYVRGASLNAIMRENVKVNRAVAASAAGMGAKVFLSDRPGYFPVNNNLELADLSVEVMKEIMPENSVVKRNDSWNTGCTDMGDIASVIPAIHPHISGAVGSSHGENYFIKDRETAIVTSAKGQLLLAAYLLENSGERVKQIRANAKLTFPSIKAYFEAVDKLFLDKQAVIYEENGKITLDYQN